MKKNTYNIKVTMQNGFSIEKVEAKSFAAACLEIEKRMSRNFTVPVAFELITL